MVKVGKKRLPRSNVALSGRVRLRTIKLTAWKVHDLYSGVLVAREGQGEKARDEILSEGGGEGEMERGIRV